MQALRRYHADVVQEAGRGSIADVCKTIEIPPEWYIKPLFSFRGAVGTLIDQQGMARRSAIDIAQIQREGSVKIEYQDKDEAITGLTLTIEYDLNSVLSLSVLKEVSKIFKTMKNNFEVDFTWSKQ